MTVLKCDRCGMIYKESDGKEYSIQEFYGLTFKFLDLCPNCQNELKVWLENPKSKSTEDS